MSNTNKKTVPEVAASETANENLSKDSTPALYMLKRGDDTRDCFGTWSGTPLPKSDYIEVAVRFSDLQAAYKNGSAAFRVNPDCVLAYDAHIYKLRAREAEQRRQEEEREEERSARFDEELSLIKSITGMDLSREDLPLIMLEYRRAGKDFERFLDALEAVDDLDLQRVGLTAWEWDNDER